jgi:pimeloyl-ACP methyl ester carboxylesterase
MIDTSRNNRQIPVEVYYPSLSAGEEVPVAPGQFPVLSFGHGFVMGVDAYTNFSDFLVPEGYILALANTETGISPSHGDFGLDLSFIIQAMSLANADPASLFFGAVDSTSAVMGHSMGGGASMLSAGSDPGITAVVNLAAAETNPSAIAAATNITVPALLFSGSADCVTPPAQHQQPMYDSIASACKTLISITGGGHCYFANYNFLCTFGENSCGPNLTITREEQQATTFTFLLPWLDRFLKDDAGAWETFLDSLASSELITFQHECDLTGIPGKRNSQLDIRVYPVPFSDYLFVEGVSEFSSLKVFDLAGREVYCSDLVGNGHEGIFLGFLHTGIYQLVFTGSKGAFHVLMGIKL